MNDRKISLHQKQFAIEWGDMDALGHVNNGRYFDYFQEARIEWLESLQLDMKQTVGPVVVHTACTFLKPIIYPASVTLISYLQQLGRTSMVVEHAIYQDEQLMTEGLSKIVWVDYQLNKSLPLPEVIRQLAHLL